MSNDTPQKTLTVALLLCLVCSFIVSLAAVKLRPIQEENKVDQNDPKIIEFETNLQEKRRKINEEQKLKE